MCCVFGSAPYHGSLVGRVREGGGGVVMKRLWYFSYLIHCKGSGQGQTSLKLRYQHYDDKREIQNRWVTTNWKNNIKLIEYQINNCLM